jgi:hypothetical protein
MSIPGYSIVSIRQLLSQAGELQTPKETFGRLCRTGSICPVLTVSKECPEYAILGIIQPKRVLTSIRDEDLSISLCDHLPRRHRTPIRNVIR